MPDHLSHISHHPRLLTFFEIVFFSGKSQISGMVFGGPGYVFVCVEGQPPSGTIPDIYSYVVISPENGCHPGM